MSDIKTSAEHISKNQLSTLIGVPQRAIVRWMKQVGGIPYAGEGDKIMFPKQAALDWVEVNRAPLHRRNIERFGR